MVRNMKFSLQDDLYYFPYHYLPSLENGPTVSLHRYLEWGLEYMTYMSFAVETVQKYEPLSLCDVGCGDGRLLDLIKPFTPELTGIDLSERAIAFARAFNPDVEILCGDIADLSVTYHWITLIEVLEHIPDDQLADFMQNVARLQTANGRLLVTVPTINVPLNPKHYRHYDLDKLASLLEPYFEIESHWWLYRRGYLEKVVRHLLSNRLFVLNSIVLRRFIWRLHKRYGYYASSTTGAHLACLARTRTG